ncbi:MAG TPA: hypothetical protein VMY87_04590, partial [Armatimonadota bacterium]|nr:hypothetical protein [Armatimonadota bacterium]
GRRVAGCPEPRVAAAVRRVIAEAQRDTSGQETRSCPTDLTEEVVAWLREQLGQPRARQRELGELAERLRGRELTKQEVLRIVAEWLGEGEGLVEVV